ncbi:cobalt-precorrin-5B (C(1))-methyltransferase [Bacterioplanoides sp.]|uniref:cobalt-precorrin-5B (C(1))-methyltransferase n=1 Tax=Bacterioplanoides sp. TaxID=2066072 RepID=UPI003B5C672C
MWPESQENSPTKKLRTGYTTGCCATACCVAAAEFLLGNKKPKTVSVLLPQKRRKQTTDSATEADKYADLAIVGYQPIEDSKPAVRTSTIKDAGDDPDVTHGAEIISELYLTKQPGITFHAAEGVGTVTREGLLLAVGEPAINPVPRQMISQHLRLQAKNYNYAGGFRVAIGVKNGEDIAQKTMNPRLGIIGGLSILGTTGIVRPFSCAAYIASIHQGVDVASHNNHFHIGASTGTSSERLLVERHQLADMALIEMGDFAGALLKYLRTNRKITRLSLSGGFGKISKLAQGHLDLHSRTSAIDLTFIRDTAAEAGANNTLCEKILTSNTSIEALTLCQQQNIPLADALCRKAHTFASRYLPEQMELEVLAINRHGDLVGSSNAFPTYPIQGKPLS